VVNPLWIPWTIPHHVGHFQWVVSKKIVHLMTKFVVLQKIPYSRINKCLNIRDQYGLEDAFMVPVTHLMYLFLGNGS